MGLCGISSRFQLLSPTLRQIAHALLTRSPLSYPKIHPKTSFGITPFDLHVLGAPPAFVLSQDQTLYKWYLITYKVLNHCIHSARNRLRPCELLCLELFYVIFHHEKGSLQAFDIVQFSRSCAFRSCVGQLDYYNSVQAACQVLF